VSVDDAESRLPGPALPLAVDVTETGAASELTALPTRAGVYALEDGSARTVMLGVTADLRRRVRAKLAAPEASGPPGAGDRPGRGERSRRPDLRPVVRRVRATTVASAFEADWAYLQLARQRLPETFSALTDRWRGWFVHCDPTAEHPRLVRVSAPGGPAASRTGVHVGPFADKHAAGRAIDALHDLFDLCRYHHILVETPHANACAYKEMGRCPAPCDGSIPMSAYRDMVRDALAFATSGAAGVTSLETRMHEASARLAFEEAERWRRRLDAFRGRLGADFVHVDRLDRFSFVAVLPSERDDHVRLVLIRGGRIEPWADVARDVSPAALDGVTTRLNARVEHDAPDLSPDAMPNVGLVCRHLFRDPGSFVPLRAPLTAAALHDAVTRVHTDDAGASVTELDHEAEA
jgi:DNA polymerase-3 subunit epsilon